MRRAMPLVVDDALASRYDRPGHKVSRRIDHRDEMLRYSVAAVGRARATSDYFRHGADIARLVEQLVEWGGLGAVGGGATDVRDQLQVLEFACGYGRIMRHLAVRFEPSQLTGSDIDAAPLRFVSSECGVATRLSVDDPMTLDWSERFDLIIVPSLFSHLPHATFGAWIGALARLLTERGVLALSANDKGVLAAETNLPAESAPGMVYVAYNETDGRLDPSRYGSAFVTEAYVADRISELVPAPRYARVPRGYWDYQDLYLLVGPDQRDPATFEPAPSLQGYVDRVEIVDTPGGRRATVLGWARSRRRGLRVTVEVAGSPAAEIDTFLDSPDVAEIRGPGFERTRYAVEVDLPAADDGWLVVTGHDECEEICYVVAPLKHLAASFEPPPPPAPALPQRIVGRLRRAIGRWRRFVTRQ